MSITNTETTKQETFMALYDACHDAFVRYCTAMSYGKMDTEDLIQDILLSAYQNFESIKNKGQLLHYLIRAAKNKSISNWRKTKYKAELLEQHNDRLIAQGVHPDTLLDISFMYKMLGKLPELQRDAIVLFEISGFSMKEIAVLQNSTEGAVKTKISRGRKKLRELFIDDSGSSSISSIFNQIKSITL